VQKCLLERKRSYLTEKELFSRKAEFTGGLIKVTVTMDDDQMLDGDGVGRAQLAHQ
jgi:hypothetical protein